jgi:hypothetical protein
LCNIDCVMRKTNFAIISLRIFGIRMNGRARPSLGQAREK